MRQSALITNTGDECTKGGVIKSIILTHSSNNKAETGEAIWIFVRYRFCALAHFGLNKRSRFSEKTGHKNTERHTDFTEALRAKNGLKGVDKNRERRRGRWKKEGMKKRNKNRKLTPCVLKVFNVS